MNEPPEQLAESADTPKGRPARRDLLVPMLEGTKRTFVPVRRIFIQKPKGTTPTQGSSLSLLARGSVALDAYLWIHALASSSEPYLAAYPAATWVQLARLDKDTSFGAAKAHWSKVVTKLHTLGLIERVRKGNEMQYRLLDESGDGTAYVRPKTAVDGNWLRLPYEYWFDEFDQELTHPEKLMLLIALDQVEEFELPVNRAPSWYGIAESTAHRGLKGLERRGLLDRSSTFKVSPRSPSGWAEYFHYTLRGPFSKKAISDAQADSQGRTHLARRGGA